VLRPHLGRGRRRQRLLLVLGGLVGRLHAAGSGLALAGILVGAVAVVRRSRRVGGVRLVGATALAAVSDARGCVAVLRLLLRSGRIGALDAGRRRRAAARAPALRLVGVLVGAVVVRRARGGADVVRL